MTPFAVRRRVDDLPHEGRQAQATMPRGVCGSEADMKRVTGIGGIFFKAKDAVALRA
jgi:hypothetical protein